MSMPEQFKKAAVETVTRILSDRLKLAGISTTRPDFYFQCEANELREFPGGVEVRVKTWFHWSEAIVELDGNTGELMAYSIDRYAEPSNDQEMTQEEALAVASRKIELPDDAVLRSFNHFIFAPNCKLARLEWERFHQGLRVDGDYLFVTIHPQTHRIVMVDRKWRTLHLT